MLKRILCLLTALLLVACLLCSCEIQSSRDDDDDDDRKEKSSAKKETEAEDDTATEPTTEEDYWAQFESTSQTPETTAPTTTEAPQPEQPTVTIDPNEWKQAYLTYISNLDSNTEFQYKLFHLDGDDLPELFINGNCEAAGSTVCTYYKGQVVTLVMGRLGGVSYIPNSGMICNYNGNMGYYYLEMYLLTEGSFVRQLYYTHATEPTMDGYNHYYQLYDENNNPTPSTQDECSQKESALFDHSLSQHIGGYYDTSLLSYSQILQELA